MEGNIGAPAACTSSTDFVNEVISNNDFKQFFKNLINEAVLQQLNEHVKNFNTVVRKLKDDVADLNVELEKVKGELHEIHQNLEQQSRANQINETHMGGLTNTLHNRSQTIEDLQQYTRRNCVLVSGIPEEAGENTDEKIIKLANEKMEVPLTGHDIDRTHRTGKRIAGKHRPIVVKFCRYNMRYKFIKSRKNLKGTKVGVQELLTPYTQHLLKRANELVSQSRYVKAAWTWDGRVCVQIEQNGRKRTETVKHHDDLQKIFDQTAGYSDRDEY